MIKKTSRIMCLALIVLGLSTTTSYAQWDWLKEKAGTLLEDPVSTIKETSLSETELGQGLKEALKIGINNAVSAVSQKGGYADNEEIKIPLPEALKFLDTGLRRLGMGAQVDEFVASMNQSAEAAAPAARDIFLDALFDMTIEDAEKIFQGGDTAATEYFKSKTYDKLVTAFQPTIDQMLAKYDVTNKYNEMIEKYSKIPFASKVSMLSPDDYVINSALDGLFVVLGQEETKIRQDPAARVTDILKKVFK